MEVSEATVYNWEKGRTDPPAKYFAKGINKNNLFLCN